MGDSLREQLLKAGLVSKEKAHKAKRQQVKKKRGQRGVRAEPSPEERERQRAHAEKAARDRALNEKKEEARRQREIAAQISQLIEANRHPRAKGGDDEMAFHFNYRGKIKRIHVSPPTHRMISDGRLVIVNHNGRFELVPADVAGKIRARNPALVIELPEEPEPDADDPYAAYQVPDDLMW